MELSIEFLKENELKYGKKENDRIAKEFAKSLQNGASFCFGLTLKYLDRFLSEGSEKSKLEADLYKAFNVCKRIEEKEILTPAQILSVEVLIEKKQIHRLIDYLELIQINFLKSN